MWHINYVTCYFLTYVAHVSYVTFFFLFQYIFSLSPVLLDPRDLNRVYPVTEPCQLCLEKTEQGVDNSLPPQDPCKKDSDRLISVAAGDRQEVVV